MVKILLLIVVTLIVVGFIASEQQRAEVAINTSSLATGSDEGTDNVATEEGKKVDEVENERSVVSNSNVLDLSGQGLNKVPMYVFDKTDVQELNLSNNILNGSLQAEVRHLQNLKILDLSNNQFTGVPAEIGQLKNLEVLNLANNQLTGLPHELGNLSNLKVLNLKGNNYASADLNIIKQNLPPSTVVQVD